MYLSTCLQSLRITYYVLRFYLISCIHPGSESAEQGLDGFIAIVHHEERRTGARVFVLSGAVGDDPLAFFEREVANISLDIIERNRDRSSGMTICV